MTAQNSGGSAGDGGGRKPPTGRPFTPGDPRINRGGRPKGLAKRIRELAGEDGEELVEIAWKIAKGKLRIQKATQSGLEKLPPSAKERMEAVEFLAKHGYGEPPKRVELTGADGGPVEVQPYDLTRLTDEELDAIERLQSRMAPEPRGDTPGEGTEGEGEGT